MRPTQTTTVPHLAVKTEVLTLDGTVNAPIGQEIASRKENFYNGLKIAVTVVYRSGARAQFPASRGGTGLFTVLQVHEYQRAVNLDNADLSSDCGSKTSELAEKIIQALGLTHQPNVLGSFMDKRYTLKHTLTLEDLQRHNGSVYLPALDIVVSSLPIAVTPPHPYCMAMLRNRLIEMDPIFQHVNGLHYQIRIVDRSGVFGLTWINLNGKVFQIPVITEGEYQDGVYLISSHPSEIDGTFNYARADYYQFSDITEEILPLYRTRSEAATLGDPESAYKRELDRDKHSNALAEAALRRERQEMDHAHAQRTRELEREREEAKHKLLEREEKLKEQERILAQMEADYKIRDEQLKRDMLMAKSMTEKQSHQRKALLEALKFGPAVIVGVVGIVKAVQKIREKK